MLIQIELKANDIDKKLIKFKFFYCIYLLNTFYVNCEINKY